MAIFNQQNPIFMGNSKNIGVYIENQKENFSEIDFQKIESELNTIKATLEKGTVAYNAVVELQNGVAQRDIASVAKSIKKFANQFSVATLANLAGASLCKFFGL